MDIDQLKPLTTSAHAHMDMMLMMHMEKLPEFTGSYSDTSDQIPSLHFSQSNITPNCTNAGAIQHFMQNQNQHATNFPSNNMSFSCVSTNSNQEPLTDQAFLCNNINASSGDEKYSHKRSSMAAMREMIFRIASMQPIHIDPESIKPPKRRNVKISKDPQSIAARHRRERISERIRILQRLVPGGTKMDTASMLDEAIHYVKFLKSQVQTLERAAASRPAGLGFPVAMSSGSYLPMGKAYQPQNVQHFYGDA